MWILSLCFVLLVPIAIASPTSTHVPPTPASSKTTTTSKPTAVPPSPTQSGLSSDCTKYYDVKSGDTCFDISEQFGITTHTFYKLNPAVGNQCHNLLADYYVCVGTKGTTTIVSPATPSPEQSGITKNCTKFYKAKPSDACIDLEEKFHFTLAQFRKWNPAVGPNCTNFIKGYYYCVAV